MNFKDIEKKVDVMKGFLRIDEAEWLFNTTKQLPDDSIVLEIGALFGKSTCVLAFGCVGSSKHVFTIDPFINTNTDLSIYWKEGESFFTIWQNNIKKNNLLEYISPLVGFSQDVAKMWSKPINLLFIDGSHYYKDVKADFDNFYPYVISGGIIAFHDVDSHGSHEGVVKVWEEKKEKLIKLGKVNRMSFGYKK